MKKTPSSSPDKGISWFGGNIRRLAIISALMGSYTVCQTDQENGPAEAAERASISDQEAIREATKTVEQYLASGYDKVALPPRNIIEGKAYRLGDDNWDGVFDRATLNSVGDFPEAFDAEPENTIVVYLTLESGSGIVVALDKETGRFISMDGDN